MFYSPKESNVIATAKDSHPDMFEWKIATCTTILILALGWNMAAQGHPQAAEIFSRLLAPKTTDKAAEELLRSAKTDPSTRKYLSEHLPTVIEKGPKVYGEPWLNAVRLAGELKISEAAPALRNGSVR